MKQFRCLDTGRVFDYYEAVDHLLHTVLDGMLVGEQITDDNGMEWERLHDVDSVGPDERLERIATAVFASMVNASPMLSDAVLARTAVDFAKALIAELDKQS